MTPSVADNLRRVLERTQLQPEGLLWGMLIGAFLFSTVHLLTLFLTRWGERRITGKALLLSVMVHFAFVIGVVTTAPPQSVPSGGTSQQPEEEHTVLIRSVPAEKETTERNEMADAGMPSAVWEKLPPPKNSAALTRPALKAPSKVALKSPDRLADQGLSMQQASRDLASPPDSAPATPAPAQQNVALPPLKQFAKTPEIEIPKNELAAKKHSSKPSIHGQEASAGSKVGQNVSRQSSVPSKARHGALPGPNSTGLIVPTVEGPTVSIAEIPHEESLRGDPAPPTAVPAEPAPAPKSAERAPIPALGRERRTGPRSEAHAEITVERLRPTTSTADSQRPSASTNDYQPLDTRILAPSPQLTAGRSEPLLVHRTAGVPSTYRLRKLSNRKANARQYGGNDRSELAVEASLRWLASVQTRGGYWDADVFGAGQVKVDESGVDRDNAGRDADSGVTALAVLAFLGAGYTHEEGKYAETVDRALHWLISQQQPDGNFGQSAGHFAMMYCHGMATYAVAEAYGMQNDPTSNVMLRDPLIRGVRYILDNQNPDGGWRYVKGQKSDMSMFGWQLMALKSAEIAGVSVPRNAKVKMVAFLKQRSLGEDGGLAGYREELPPTPSMTAEALFCKQMLGMKRTHVSAREAGQFLLARLPKESNVNEYYWYYGTLAMYQLGGDRWQTWNNAIRDILISEQRTSGEFAGSWDPVSPWSKFGGRIYSTALSALCLEVYYRFLPLYQLGGEGAD
jgi:hypothetical protein